jgi:hypothetical protein
VAVGTGRLELEADRPRWAIREEAWARSHGVDGIRKATVVSKGRNAQKAIQNVGDRYLSREEVGTDEPGQDIEGEGGTFREARAIEVDDPKSRSTTRKKGSPQAR